MPESRPDSLNSTPRGDRTHIAIYGNRNAGKSSLLNAIVGQEVAIVSEVKGTTTDPVSKTMELLPYGPVVFIDTAGLDDDGLLGDLRVEKTKKVLQRTDFALLIHDVSEFDEAAQIKTLEHFKIHHIPYLIVFNKTDLTDAQTLKELKSKYHEALFVSAHDMKSVLHLKDVLIKKLQANEEDPPIIGDIIPYGGTVVMVIPVDSEAPKGRIILPQMQLLRDCLDHGIKSYVVRDTELEDALKDLPHVDLVVTDSQAFDRVSKIVPSHMPLTSFSIVFARHKGDLKTFIDGISAIRNLKDGAKILVSESCTHNHSHEDIGRYKIPTLLNKKEGKTFEYVFRMGHDFPTDLASYDLIIHCGSCMLNKKTMITRIRLANEAEVPITNYGVVLAYITDILDRTTQIEGLI